VIPGMLQSALEPFGLQAAAINTLWWLLLVVCTAVWVAVMVALALALFRRNRTEQLDPQDGEPRKVRVVGAAVGMTGAILIVFVAYSVVVARSTTRTPSDEDRPVRIVVTAHQWWTANELHMPVGRPVAGP
jgi:cytochrome c oxidase subunit II